MKYDTYISLGFNCNIAQTMVKMNMRSESYPFDWLLVSYELSLGYIADLIDTNFEHFTTDLSYNTNNKVVPKRYPRMEFYHHDLIANKIYKNSFDKKLNENLIDTFNRRANRFMDTLKSDKKVLLIAYFEESEKAYNKNRPKKYTQGLKKLLESIKQFKTEDKVLDVLIIIKKTDENIDIDGIKQSINDKYRFYNTIVEYTDESIETIIRKYL